MDAYLTNYRKRLLPALTALSVGLVLSTGLQAEESDSSSVRSARGTVVFVTPSKPVASAKSTPQQKKSRRAETSSQVTRRAIAKTPRRGSAQGDLVLVPQNQVQPSFTRSRSTTNPTPKTRELARKTATPQPSQQPETASSTGTGQVVEAMRNRRTVSNAEQTVPGNQLQVAEHQEEVDSPNPIAKLLIDAHAISLVATTEADYSQIVEHCSSALRQGASKEERQFASQLNSWALNRRGQLRVDEGLQELADADFQESIDNNSHNWRAFHNRGVSYAQLGSFAEAFDDFNRVIQLNPEYSKAFVNRATLFMQANDLPSALKDYRIAAELDPEFARAQLGIGRSQQMLGKQDEALVFFDAAVQLDSENAEILCSRGDLLADLGQYGKALADYALAIEVNPQFAHAYRNGSWLLATCPDSQFRDPENALLGARQALEFDYGQRHVALDTLAAALASTGQYDEAISTLNKALALAPDESKSAYNKRLGLYQQQQPFRTQRVGEVTQAVFEVTDK